MFFSASRINSFLSFRGQKRTPDFLLKNLTSNTSNLSTIINSLKNTGLFDSVSLEGYTVKLSEKRKDLRFFFSKKGHTVLSLVLPNLFCAGELVTFKSSAPTDILHLQNNTDTLFNVFKRAMSNNTFQTSVRIPFVFFDKLLNFNISGECSEKFMGSGKMFNIQRGAMKISSFIFPSNAFSLGTERISLEDSVKNNIFSQLSCRLLSFDLLFVLKHYLNDVIVVKQDDSSIVPKKSSSSDISMNAISCLFRGDKNTVKEILEENFYYYKSTCLSVPGSLSAKVSKSARFFLGPFTFDFNAHIRKLFFTNMAKPFYDLLFINNVRGYKRNAISPRYNNEKIGGTTCFSLNASSGLNVTDNLSIFSFVDCGVNTRQSILKTVSQVFSSDEKSLTVGKSVGFGIKLKDSLSFIYSIPLTNNIETENFSINFSIE